jgi:POT family proton-dependent oligopeptide transporter
MMGVWFAATLPADILAGFLGGFWSSMAKANFFLMIASIAAAASVAIWVFQTTGWVKALGKAEQ